MNGIIRMTLAAGVLLGVAASASAQMLINGAGATFPYPLYSKWFDQYQKKAGVQISYQSIGSGGGIRALKAGTVDFGASDAPLSNEETKDMPGPVVHVPTVAGAVVISYNLPGIDKGLRLTPEVIADIFLGKLTRWDDRRISSINPGRKLPNQPIAVAHRSDGSGTTYIFTNYLAAVSRTWSQRVGAGKSVNWPVGVGAPGNPGVAGVIKQSPGGIGYIELAYAVQNKLPYAQVRNRAGKFVTPSVASTTAAAAGAVKAMQRDVRVSVVNAAGADTYPIAGFTYLLVYQRNRSADQGKTIAAFLRWAMTDGQKEAAKLLYAPLPKAVVTLNEAAINKIR